MEFAWRVTKRRIRSSTLKKQKSGYSTFWRRNIWNKPTPVLRISHPISMKLKRQIWGQYLQMLSRHLDWPTLLSHSSASCSRQKKSSTTKGNTRQPSYWGESWKFISINLYSKKDLMRKSRLLICKSCNLLVEPVISRTFLSGCTPAVQFPWLDRSRKNEASQCEFGKVAIQSTCVIFSVQRIIFKDRTNSISDHERWAGGVMVVVAAGGDKASKK